MARHGAERVEQRTITFTRDSATIDAFVALPSAPASTIVTVLHGNAGLPADVKDTALWAASLGYVGLAVNPTAREPDGRLSREFLLGTAFGERYLEDTRAGIAKLRSDRLVGDGKVGAFGYCGGGYVALMWAASDHGKELSAIVGAHVATQHLRGSEDAYHRPPGIDYYRSTSAPVQLHQGGADDYTPPQDIAAIRQLAESTRKALEVYVYPEADHGFAMHTNDTYRPSDAELVHARAAFFLKRHLD
ncbi:MAG TPA: dienelactone hydrolase family protein [Sphingomicrobium sp.]|nr:dienelactone hydrolase family protein [Sphingomicrobium sp.]